MNAPRRLTATSALGAALLTVAPSFAQSAQALYDSGLAAFKAGRYDEACPAIEQSYKLGSGGGGRGGHSIGIAFAQTPTTKPAVQMMTIGMPGIGGTPGIGGHAGAAGSNGVVCDFSGAMPMCM
jgi:hypothetical protein